MRRGGRIASLRFPADVRGSPIGVLVAEADGERIVEANSGLLRMSAMNPRADADPIADIAHIGPRPGACATANHRSGHFVVASQLSHTVGRGVWARVAAKCPCHGQWDMTRTGFASSRTVHRQKKAEAELRAGEENGSGSGQLSCGIAHDFNNLSAYIGNVGILIYAYRTIRQCRTGAGVLSSALSGADTRHPPRCSSLRAVKHLHAAYDHLNGMSCELHSILRRSAR